MRLPNQTTQLHRVAAALPEVETWFSPYYGDTSVTLMRRCGLIEGTIGGNKLRGRCLSYQSVRDISALAAVPGLTIVSPSCAREVELLFDWCIEKSRGSSVLRLESVPCVVPYRLPEYEPAPGIGITLRAGRDAVFVGYGPMLLSQAYAAAELLEREGLSVGVENLPWLNRIVCLDNHYVSGGQGALLAASNLDGPPRIDLVGVEGIPACGTNAEVLRHHRLDARGLAERLRQALRSEPRGSVD